MRDCQGQQNRTESFEKIDHEHRITELLSKNASHVCGTDISASDFSHINATQPPNDISSRKRSDQVSDQTGAGEAKKWVHATGISEAWPLLLCKALRRSHICKIDRSAEVTPLIRAASPSDVGRTLLSFCRASELSPLTVSKLKPSGILWRLCLANSLFCCACR